MRITGKCHCGNVAFTLEWNGDPTAIPARTCTCSFCRKHGGVWTFEPSLLQHARASFDGEDVESRLARRKRNWIAEVRFGDRPRDRDR